MGKGSLWSTPRDPDVMEVMEEEVEVVVVAEEEVEVEEEVSLHRCCVSVT